MCAQEIVVDMVFAQPSGILLYLQELIMTQQVYMLEMAKVLSTPTGIPILLLCVNVIMATSVRHAN